MLNNFRTESKMDINELKKEIYEIIVKACVVCIYILIYISYYLLYLLMCYKLFV